MTFLWFCSFSWLFRNFIYFMILLEFLFSMFMAIRDLVHFHDFLRLCLIFINFFGDFISFLWHFFWDIHFHELYFPFFHDLEIINFGVFNNFHEESNVSMTLEEKHMHFFFIVDYTIASLKMIWEWTDWTFIRTYDGTNKQSTNRKLNFALDICVFVFSIRMPGWSIIAAFSV